jgi:PAS domain S-box-containing protein
MSLKSILARELVYTTNYVEGTMTVSEVKAWFQSQLSAVSLGVILGGGKFGLINRGQLSKLLLGEKFSGDLLGKPVSAIMIDNPLVVQAEQTIDQIVPLFTLSMQNEEEAFFNDIIVRDGAEFVGLISARELLTNYIDHVSHQLSTLQAQQRALIQKNKEMFESTFKRGFQDSQYRQMIEESCVPMLLFDENGKLLAFNQRYAAATGHHPQMLTTHTTFGSLFDETFLRTRDEVEERRHNAEKYPEDFYRPLSMRLNGGGHLPVTAYVNLTGDGKRIMVNILEIQEVHEEAPARLPVPAAPQATAGGRRGRGKITQAIQTRISERATAGLARTVAASLIDREGSMDRLMQKLERIIEVAEKIEETGKIPGPEDEHSVIKRAGGNRLTGNLSEFSAIDLCQILAQGMKTGRLMLHAPDGEAHSGSIYFHNGQIVHAANKSGLHGIDAMRALLGLRAGRFDFLIGDEAPNQTITGDTMGLLMEACQHLDEKGG